MRIFIMVDMEGISGIFCSDQVSPDKPEYQVGRKYLTWDTNACIEGCFQGGATSVIVRDAHGGGGHFIWEDLDPRAQYARGIFPGPRMPGIENCDGLILLGYHAMAGTPHAILEHTMSSRNWQNFWLNGRLMGEIGIDAAIAGDFDVPTIMVSGDDKACREARNFIPGIATVEVKRGLGCQGGILLSKEEAHRRISEGAKKAVGLCKKIRPFKVRKPVRMRLELVSRGRVPEDRKGVRIIDGRTYEVTARSVEEALNAL
ncbi:MAG: M55 family metallopeptidase [Kiritimatiellia bacterium]